METATSLVIMQLADYLRGLTQRLDPGTGWYGEFLRRDPEGMRACLDGRAMAPWDVVESLLADLEAARGAQFAERETAYAARLRAAAVTAWDRLPGGEAELRTLLAASAAQRADSEAALRHLTARLSATTGPAEAEALSRELAWIRDDATRATSRQADLTSRLAAMAAPEEAQPAPEDPAGPGSPLPGGRPATGAAPGPDRPMRPASVQEAAGGEPLEGVPRQRTPEGGQRPVGRAEGRWLRGGRRSGGARYAGSAAPEPLSFTLPPGADPGAAAPAPNPAPRGARFGSMHQPPPTAPEPGVPSPAGHPAADGPTRPESGTREAPPAGRGGPEPAGFPGDPATAGTSVRGLVGELLGLRAQHRTGEAHALLCEAAAWPAARLPALAAELNRAGLAADWATLLWEAASLPPEHLAAVAAALGEAGREADCDLLLRQGAARPAAEIADAALALGAAGRDREAQALLGAYVRLHTAEESAVLARHDPQWFAPRLLHAARAQSGTRHRDLSHALRVSGVTVHQGLSSNSRLPGRRREFDDGP
ncbi:hypothetical protein ACIGFK_23635 [Streptomyces sp. NPDC085524]|uniref:hypothetical protein n=1 Tax=Streptomyces sp. NPDC085524 TaxID=3365728 RepID=UPI0037D27ED4